MCLVRSSFCSNSSESCRHIGASWRQAKKQSMSKTVAEKMYAEGFAETPPGLIPEAPSDSQTEAQSSSAKAKAKSQPMRASGQPARRPGQHYQNYVGIDPKALVELKRIEDNTMNEVERNEIAIKICMKHLVENSKETFEQVRERYEYRNKGSGYDFYPKCEFINKLNGVNLNIGLLELQKYMIQ